MKSRFLWVVSLAIACLFLVNGNVTAQTAMGTPVFNSIPSSVPPNVVSSGFQCCATAELGDEIRLEADTPRRAGYVTVLMSSWSLHSDYPTMPAAGYTHPITLNIYADAASAAAHTTIFTVTKDFLIPWRPEATPTCGTAWLAADGKCYNGFAFTITFDLRASNLNLPNQFIYGIAYNTDSWGYNPIGTPGPYDSLNVGLNSTSFSVGTDVTPGSVYWNTSYAPFYTDGGAGGVGTFRVDTWWTTLPNGLGSPYTPAVQFTTFAVPTTGDSCKNGAWANLVRSDFTSFKNQGACVSYVKSNDHNPNK